MPATDLTTSPGADFDGDSSIPAEVILGQIYNILICNRANVVTYVRELKINLDIVTDKYQEPP